MQCPFLDNIMDRIESEWDQRPVPRNPVVAHSLYVGQAIEVDDFPWQIRNIDTDGNVVTLNDKDSGDMIYRSVGFVTSNTM